MHIKLANKKNIVPSSILKNVLKQRQVIWIEENTLSCLLIESLETRYKYTAKDIVAKRPSLD